jgi:hypothetical protein
MAIGQDRARTALTVLAALLRTGQAEMVAKNVQQGYPWRDPELFLHPVDSH